MVDEKRIVVREVGLRDGLQSLPEPVAEADRVALGAAIAAAGVRRLEVGSFVSPRAVPQMQGTAAVIAALRRVTDASLEVLVPNRKGAELALEAGVDVVVVVVAASDTFSRRNVRMGTDEALAQAGEIAAILAGSSARASAVVATAFGCAYEGPVPTGDVERVVGRLVEHGFDELVLADTTGTAGPLEVTERFAAATRVVGSERVLGLHFHDTRGLALVNVQAGLAVGCTLFDASIGGLGGCPFSPGATGNVATEDLIHLLDCVGRPTGIDVERLIEAAELAEQVVGERLPGHVLRAGPRFATGREVVRG